MAECPSSQSVMSKTFSYLEKCGKSTEFLRRACTYTPKSVKWAGDFVITDEAMLHQSLMKYMDGSGACEAEHTFPAASEECGEVTARPDGLKDVEDTDIRESDGSFLFTVLEGEPGWDIHIAATNDDGCGGSMAPQDGGDILFDFDGQTKIKSLCGTIEISSYGAPQAFYLDNRVTYKEDIDAGLLVALQHGITKDLTVLYAKKDLPMAEGLIGATDVSTKFLTALAAHGIGKADVISFGMI